MCNYVWNWYVCMNMYINTIYTCCIRSVTCNWMSCATCLMQLHKFAVACVAWNWILIAKPKIYSNVKCLKWARWPIWVIKHKLWLKETSRIKLVVWFPTTKSRQLPRFPCIHVTCNIALESSQQGLQLCFKPHFNWRST
jgi:hypothetical protein